jgi:DNA (cytosine-5)-methyltransferase 1
VDCRQTIEDNTAWRLAEQGDVEGLDQSRLLGEFGIEREELTLVAGGPPCQPFSKSGQWLTGRTARMADPRAETLRKYFEIVDAALPRVMLLENVRGLVAEPRDGSTDEIALELLHRALDAINDCHGTSYAPSIVHLDAADFGVPHRRERVFVLAARDGRAFVAPAATHGGEGQHRYAITWDCLGELDATRWPPELNVSGTWAGLLPTIPEGCNYLHHTPKGAGEPLSGWGKRAETAMALASARAARCSASPAAH